MSNPTGFVIVAPLALLGQITALPIEGGWGNPTRSANGLIAFGVWDSVAVPDNTRSLASAIAGVTTYDLNSDWRSLSGWVEVTL